eukprot:TRINITY_DN16768_c0_g1_i1.p1 TRINITY_DN16768_c0_g1~~TRINITY_DN16768_c0_g1_i1.p1  ORF type:complete len:498 (+),score=123.42 TRINITY_DN16768_c0_g1_i1:62-1555(+)
MQPFGRGRGAPTARYAPYGPTKRALPQPLLRRARGPSAADESPSDSPSPTHEGPIDSPWREGRAAPQPLQPPVLPPHDSTAAPPAGPPPSWDLPFGAKHRTPAEVYARRTTRPVLRPLVKQTCHWVDLPEGANFTRPHFRPRFDAAPLTLPEPVPAPEWGEANVTYIYALLATGIGPHTARHVLRRIDVVVRSRDEGGAIEAYGGATDMDSLELQMAHLSMLVEAQAGVSVASWLPLVEFTYRNSARSLFFIPVGLDGAKVFAKAAHETAGFTPRKAALADLLDYKMDGSESRAMTELLMAVDAYDEFMARDIAVRLITVLQDHAVYMSSISDESIRRRENAESEHHRRVEEKASLAAQKHAEHERLRALWKEEDLGKTDRQKAELLVERQRRLHQLGEECRYVEPEETTAALEPGVAAKVRMTQSDEKLLLFQYFDRPKSTACGVGEIPRSQLADVLLCLCRPDLRSRKHVDDLLDCLPIGARVPYHEFSTAITRL